VASVHYVLSGDVWSGSGPLAFVLAGGAEVGDVDVGYGPVRVFRSPDVAEIAAALGALDLASLRAAADPSDFAANDIYPDIWDEDDDDCLGYIFSYLADLRAFVVRTRDARKGMLTYIC
jgi:hypothetical protein